MKVHRFTAFLYACVLVLNLVGGNLGTVYASEIQDTATTEISATEIQDTESTEIPASEIEDTESTEIPASEIEDTESTEISVSDPDYSDEVNISEAEDEATAEEPVQNGQEDSADLAETEEDVVSDEVSDEEKNENAEEALTTSIGDDDQETSELEEETIDEAVEEAVEETAQKEAVGSLLPLEEKQAALILEGLTETQLKEVKVSYIVDHLLDPDASFYNLNEYDHFVWSYYKDEFGDTVQDEYHQVTRDDTVDMSVFSDNTAGYKMELIVGDGNQLGENTRYIVNVYMTDSIAEFNTLELYTQDENGVRREVDAERLKYTASGSEFYVPGHQPGTMYYLAIKSEIINHPQLNVEVYTEEEYEKRLANGWQSASAITDTIVNPNMRLSDQGYYATFDEEDARTFVLIVENPETHNIYRARKHKVVIKGSSVYVNSSIWAREGKKIIKAAGMMEDPPDWTLYPIWDNDALENQDLMLFEGMEEKEEFYILLTAHHDQYGDNAVSHIRGTFEGNYDTYAAAGNAGAADLTDKLFADPDDEEFSGYRVAKQDLAISRCFSVFFDDGSACRIQMNVSEFNDSQYYTRWESYYSEPVIGEQDPWFRVTGVKQGDRELSAYVVENGKSKTLDTYYGTGYQTLFVNEYLSEEDLKALKPVFWVADSNKIRIRTNDGEGKEEISGVSEHDFTAPNEYYALFEDRQKNYVVEIVPKNRGPKLYVFGADGTEYERNREIFLDDYYGYKHDILIANVGDSKLEGLSVRLENASHVKIDDYWTVGGENNDTLEPFTSVYPTTQYAELQNLAKVRVVSDGAGEITGDLIISADGQQSVVIHLSGSAIQPTIRTSKLTYAVKYVPYSYIISTSNMNDNVDVTYELKGKLPSGMYFDTRTGELYGVPTEAGTYALIVKAFYSDENFTASTKKLELEVRDNDDETVFKATDTGYEIIPEENGLSGYVGEQVSDYKFVLNLDNDTETFISNGAYSEFEKLWINGEELIRGTDYEAEPGSTIGKLFLSIIRKRGLIKRGRNTISAQYRINNSNNESSSDSGDSSGSGSSSGSGGSSGGGGSSDSGSSSGGGRKYDSWKSNGGGGGGSTVRRCAQNFWVNTVPEPLIRTVKISNTSYKIHKGNTVKLTATANYSTKFTWTSSNPKVASVSSEGNVQAVAKGDCVITAKASDGKTVTCKIHVMIPVTSLKLAKTTLKIREGKYATLSTTVTPSSVDQKDFVWTSSNQKVATVNSSGKVTGVSSGTCTITVKAPNGKKATCKVTVIVVEISKTSCKIHKGKTIKLTASANYSTKFTWTSSNPKVATVNSTGNVRAVGKGDCVITVKTSDGKKATCKVHVMIPVTSLKMVKSTLKIRAGKYATLSTKVTPTNVDKKDFVWTSSNTKVATVNSSGKVKGVSNGTCTITVKAPNGKKATCKVTVTVVELSKTSFKIHKGKTTKLTATASYKTKFTWTSSNPKVATVNSKGSVRAVAKGDCVITAKTSDGKKATCKVHVMVPVTSLKLAKSTLKISTSKYATLSTKVTPSSVDKKDFVWTSSNTKVAKVNSSGKVTAVSIGTCTITVKAPNGKKATCKVTVVPLVSVASVTMNIASKTVNPGDAVNLTATVAPSNATVKTIKWASDHPEVATVTNGKVVAVGKGTAKITATSHNGKVASCIIKVELVPVSSITLKLNKLVLKKGSTTKLTADILPANAGDKSTKWASSNENIVTVLNGVLTGVEEGTAIVSVTSSNGKSASCEVAVVDPDTVIPEIRLSKNIVEIVEGQTFGLKADLITDDQTEIALFWESTKPQYAEVKDGLVTAKKAGYTTIIARTIYNTVATCSVKVKAPSIEVTQITLDKAEITLNPRYNDLKTEKLTATILPANATDKSIIWESQNKSVAVVKNGVVSAKKAGTTTVTARTANGMKAQCIVTVEDGFRKIRTVQDLIDVSQDLYGNYILANNIDLADMEWTPIGTGSDGFRGTFDGNGFSITGLKISSGKYIGLFSACKGTIKNLTVFGSINVNEAVNPLLAGGICGTANRATIENCESNVNITCENTGGVINCGGITGDAFFSSIINCNNHGNVHGITRNSSSNTVGAGGITGFCSSSYSGERIMNCTNDGSVTAQAIPYISNSYVRVAAGGIIGEVGNAFVYDCRSSGSIHAYSDENYSASGKSYAAAGGVIGTKDSLTIENCTGSSDLEVHGNESTVMLFSGNPIAVIQPRYISFGITEKTVSVGEKFTLTPEIEPSNASSKEVTWSSSDESVVTVVDGLVKAVGEGTATIKADSKINSEDAVCTVHVYRADLNEGDVAEIEISVYGGTYVGVNQQIQCNTTILPETALDKSLVWSSSDPSIASVDQNGLVSTYKQGTVVITAKAASGVESSISFVVKKVDVKVIGDHFISVTRGEPIVIHGRLYIDGSIRPGQMNYILYTGMGKLEAASFDIDGDTLFNSRYTGKAEITSYNVDGNIVDFTLNVDSSMFEKANEQIFTIAVFPYDNFSEGAYFAQDFAIITIK